MVKKNFSIDSTSLPCTQTIFISWDRYDHLIHPRDMVGALTDQIDAIIDYTPICVKTNTKLTNFIKLLQIKKYSGE